ncbi:hypothetical protein I79_007052 [Cricetulus griseus]|uniref:Uncharacterized protein n=1 Tax=Cricetulus griseus TaxID=10029 RepID=G3H9H9_CRIGR|nr:hypothetical protein I79_007052 [Cricetulus griseus]
METCVERGFKRLLETNLWAKWQQETAQREKRFSNRTILVETHGLNQRGLSVSSLKNIYLDIHGLPPLSTEQISLRWPGMLVGPWPRHPLFESDISSELNSGLLQELQVLLTIEPSLRP